MDKDNKIIILIVGGFLLMIGGVIWMWQYQDLLSVNWSKDGWKVVLSIVIWVAGLVMLLVGLNMAGVSLKPPWMNKEDN